MYALLAPAPHLRPFIECYWSVNITLPDSQPLNEHIFVDGKADLIFNYGDAYFREHLHDETRLQQASTNLDAQRNYPVAITQAGAIQLVGVRFFAGALSQFTSTSLFAISNHVLEPDDLFPRDCVRQLEAQLFDSFAHIGKQVELLNTFFTHQLERHHEQTFVDAAAWLVRTCGGQIDMSSLADEFGYSLRHINRYFNKQFGFTAKYYARLVRFQAMQVALMSDTALVDVAMAAGFYDQSHFVRECQTFTGMTPQAYRAYLQDNQVRVPPNLVHLVQENG
ncbi:MAG: helix-turn-helix domain-containing protein [Chloroflexota bacterium]